MMGMIRQPYVYNQYHINFLRIQAIFCCLGLHFETKELHAMLSCDLNNSIRISNSFQGGVAYQNIALLLSSMELHLLLF
jgi:hypothetical protein